jgi:hypothetical protein
VTSGPVSGPRWEFWTLVGLDLLVVVAGVILFLAFRTHSSSASSPAASSHHISLTRPTSPPVPTTSTAPTPSTVPATSTTTTTGRTLNELFDLSEWNLTLPVDANGGTGGGGNSEYAAAVIPTTQLLAGFTDSYFNLDGAGQLVFTAPTNGATTTPGSGSNHTRSELHEFYTGPAAASNGCWTSNLGGTLQATAVIDAVSADTDEATIGQIHGDGSAEFVLLIYVQSEQQILLKVYNSPGSSHYKETPIESNVTLGQPIRYRLTFTNGTISATANGSTISLTAGAGWDDYPVRFALGAYSAAPNIGNPPGDQTMVAFDSFSVSH